MKAYYFVFMVVIVFIVATFVPGREWMGTLVSVRRCTWREA